MFRFRVVVENHREKIMGHEVEVVVSMGGHTKGICNRTAIIILRCALSTLSHDHRMTLGP